MYIYIFSIVCLYFCMGLLFSISSLYCAWQDTCWEEDQICCHRHHDQCSNFPTCLTYMYVCFFVCVCQDVSYIVLCNCTAGLNTFCTEWHQDWPAQVRWKECGPFPGSRQPRCRLGKVDLRDEMSCITRLGNGAKEPTEINHAPKFTLGCQQDNSNSLRLQPLSNQCPTINTTTNSVTHVHMMSQVWASIMKFYKGQGMPTTEVWKNCPSSHLATAVS